MNRRYLHGSNSSPPVQPARAGHHGQHLGPGRDAVGAAGHPRHGLARGLPHHHEGAARVRQGDVD